MTNKGLITCPPNSVLNYQIGERRLIRIPIVRLVFCSLLSVNRVSRRTVYIWFFKATVRNSGPIIAVRVFTFTQVKGQRAIDYQGLRAFSGNVRAVGLF